ncbi:ankyrin repeat protein, partial [Wilcoxina mikolae CBS 423.85]
DHENGTPLHLAAGKNNPYMVKLLLQAGARVDLRDDYGRTPLHCLAELIKVMLDGGVQINMQNNDGKTALHLAAEMASDSIIKLLVKRGASLSIRDNSHNTPFATAALNSRSEAIGMLL